MGLIPQKKRWSGLRGSSPFRSLVVPFSLYKSTSPSLETGVVRNGTSGHPKVRNRQRSFFGLDSSPSGLVLAHLDILLFSPHRIFLKRFGSTHDPRRIPHKKRDGGTQKQRLPRTCTQWTSAACRTLRRLETCETVNLHIQGGSTCSVRDKNNFIDGGIA